MCTSPFQLMRSKAVSVSFFSPSAFRLLCLSLKSFFHPPSRSPVFCGLHADVRSVFTPCLLANASERRLSSAYAALTTDSVFFFLSSHWPPNFSLSGDGCSMQSLILFGPKGSKLKAACQAFKNSLTLFVIQAL